MQPGSISTLSAIIPTTGEKRESLFLNLYKIWQVQSQNNTLSQFALWYRLWNNSWQSCSTFGRDNVSGSTSYKICRIIKITGLPLVLRSRSFKFSFTGSFLLKIVDFNFSNIWVVNLILPYLSQDLCACQVPYLSSLLCHIRYLNSYIWVKLQLK